MVKIMSRKEGLGVEKMHFYYYCKKDDLLFKDDDTEMQCGKRSCPLCKNIVSPALMIAPSKIWKNNKRN